MDSIADEVFASFAADVGVASVRDFEVQVVSRQESEMAARRQLTDQMAKLQSKLEYERSRNIEQSLISAEVHGCLWYAR